MFLLLCLKHNDLQKSGIILFLLKIQFVLTDQKANCVPLLLTLFIKIGQLILCFQNGHYFSYIYNIWCLDNLMLLTHKPSLQVPCPQVIYSGFNAVGKCLFFLLPHSSVVHSYASQASPSFSLIFLCCNILGRITVKPGNYSVRKFGFSYPHGSHFIWHCPHGGHFCSLPLGCCFFSWQLNIVTLINCYNNMSVNRLTLVLKLRLRIQRHILL